ncbi:hypothetical protein [Streptomyces sp. NPDC059398]|uniref:hypothetical protein n=1 Tax=Streptomyces sp. NPDC059398 TaxID=3346820 RepID=UPI003693C41E
MTGHEKPKTTVSHGTLPYPRGTLVEDTISQRTGLLMGVLVERTKKTQTVVSRQAFMVPEGGGLEWDVPLERVKAVEE